MMIIVIAIHVIACIGLIFFILIQSGKGGGLIESFSSAESIFGTKTNTFLTKATTVLAITFFITCLSLAFLSTQQTKSIVEKEVKKQTSDAVQVSEPAKEVTKEVTEQTSTATEEQTKNTEGTKEANAAPTEPAAAQ